MATPKRSLRIGSLLVAGGVILALGVVYLAAPQLLTQAELTLYDQHMRLRGPRPPHPQVAVVAIDERSLREVGRWPWSRSVLGELVRKLHDAGAAAIGVDIILNEPERSGVVEAVDRLRERLGAGAPARLRDELERIVADESHDQRLAAALAESGRVVLASYFNLAARPTLDPPAREGQPLKSALAAFRNFEERGLFPPPHAEGANVPIPPLLQAAAGLGHVNMVADFDGSTRWEALVVEHHGHYYPSLALETVRLAAGIDPFAVRLDFGHSLDIGEASIPVDARARVLVDYAGPPQTFPHLSAVDVLRGRIPPERLRDVIVFVGATAEGTYDLRVTPFSPVFPGVEKHATMAANILEDRFLVRPTWVELVELTGIVLFAFVLGWLLPRFRPAPSLAVTIALWGAFLLAIHLIFRQGLWLPMVYPSLAGGLTFVGVTIYRFFTEERQRLWIKRAFQQYVSPEVVERIVDDPGALRFGGETRELTVLFSDVRDFTTFTERHDPQAVVQMLREYLTRMTDCVLRQRGTLDKYIGDAVMAIFGAPIALPDHAARACATALDMAREMEELRQRWIAEGKEPFRIGIGVNTDPMVVGNLGSEQLFDYTVIGDGVNIGARLESLNKEYKTAHAIIISESTYEAARDAIEARPLGEVTVKGKTRPLKVYELLGLKSAALTSPAP